MKTLSPITQEYLKQRLIYDLDTGIWTWKIKNDDTAANRRWNTNYAGKRAGYRRIKDGYWSVCIDGIKYLGHRLAWLYMTGEWPNQEVDHADLDPSNDRFSNLRSATHGQNKHNRKAYRNNKSGIKGVDYEGKRAGRRRRWRAQIMFDGKRYSLGMHMTKEEAAAAYEKAAKEFHGQFARSK